MLRRRVIVCLDVNGGRVVKGVRFVDLRDIGDPVALAERYEADGADEIVFLDISASAEARATLLDVARSTAERLFVPLTIGGGVRSSDDVARALRSGADKVSINSAAVRRPAVLTEAADRFGAQCVVASIDAAHDPTMPGSPWRVFVQGGRTPTDLDAVSWAAECVARGAGEILLTSIDRDGGRAGYDVALTRAVVEAVDVPVIASGGAGSEADVCAVLGDAGRADAALVAGIVHDGMTTVGRIKHAMTEAGICCRQ
ncbi:MAG TPA: imidazole glycerol phosphate synthase subunit HisF [Gemmatimonadaceae bacterium]|jgi:cyclase|nr:imidazole glycerol phosphate synthase subunit HisF [Gemmatimonadaceae bacterium]